MAFDKDKYWKNRKEGKRGQGELPKPQITESGDAERGFDNAGNIIVKNRAFRRRRIRLPGDNLFTQKTKTKKERKAFRKLGRR